MKYRVFHCCAAAALVVAFSGAASAQQCQTNDDCDDELACNGDESCVDDFCEPGIDPCPFQQCIEDQGQAECVCTNVPFLFITLEPSQSVVEPGQNVSFDITVEFDTCVDVNAYAMRMGCSIPADSGSIDAVVDTEGQVCTGHPTDPVCAGLCVGSEPCFTFIPDDCGPGVACLPAPDPDPAPPNYDGLCENSGTCLPAPFVVQNRPDFIFFDANEVLSDPDDICADDDLVNVNAVNINPGSTRVLPVEAVGPQYLGTFVYHVSEDAAGAVGEFGFVCLEFPITFVFESIDDWFGVMQCTTLFVETCTGLPDDTPCDNAVFCDGIDSCQGQVCTPLDIDPCPGDCDELKDVCIPLPPNDQCLDAPTVGVGSTVEGTTTGATFDGVPICDVPQLSGGVWYSVTGTGNTMTASTCDQADFDTMISIFCGDCFEGDSNCCFGNGTPGCDDATCEGAVCGGDPFCCDVEWDGICADEAADLCEICLRDLTCVAGQDDTPNCPDFTTKLSWCSEQGAEYLILVHGFFDTGDFSLTVSDDGQECVGAVACLPECIADATCSDGRFCNGVERCLEETCVPAGTGVSNGAFVGPADWSTDLPVGGSISFAKEQLTVVGANGGAPGFAWASQSGVDLSGVQLEFDLLSYSSDDSDENLDYPVFFLDGIFYGLNANGTLGDPTTGDAAGSGSINNASQASDVHFEVDVEELAGPGSHVIGFGVNTVDGLFGPGTAVYDNVFPEAGPVFPCPEQGGCDESANACVPLNVNMSLEASDLTPTEHDNILVEVFLESNGPVNVGQFLAELSCSATGGTSGDILAVTDIEGSECTGDANDAVCPNFCVGMTPCFTVNPEENCGPDIICVEDPDAPGSFNGFCENSGTCLAAPFIDENRDDYIFADAIQTVPTADGSSCDSDNIVNVASLNLNPGSSALPLAQKKYLGRFLYHVFTGAAGEFQLGLLDGSRLFDADGFPLPLSVQGLTIELPCTLDSQCDDPFFCNGAETCVAGRCRPGIRPCPPGECNEAANQCACATDEDCDNGDFCDGIETCNPETDLCQPGTPPCPPNLCDEESNTCDDCLSDGDCDDANECTDDVCDDGTCENTNNTDACGDGNACTENDACSGGACIGDAIAGCEPCDSDSDCDDDGPCTDDSCTAGTCAHANNSASCDDGDPCTEEDTCSSGTCAGTAIMGCEPCDDAGNCDDGDPCTPDACFLDVCVFGTAIDCDDDNTCTDDTCDTDGDCVHTNNTAACDDGDPCTTDDTCADDACAGTSVNCDDGDNCTQDSCDSNGDCVHDAIDCDDNNVCTDDTCDSSGNCVHTDNAINCDDGNQCTENDVCVEGDCTGTLNPDCLQLCDSSNDCNDNRPCTDDTCLNGGCIHTNNFADCDDGDACTENDTCESDTCTGEAIDNCVACATSSNCAAGLECLDGRCQPGQLQPCVADADCTEEGESCVGGSCRADCAGDEDCAGGETCVNGRCFGVCANDADCDDGVFCNGAEACVDNACGAGDDPCDAEFDCMEDSDTCEEAELCGSGFGCTPSSPLMGLTLLALFCLRGLGRIQRRNS